MGEAPIVFDYRAAAREIIDARARGTLTRSTLSSRAACEMYIARSNIIWPRKCIFKSAMMRPQSELGRIEGDSSRVIRCI